MTKTVQASITTKRWSDTKQKRKQKQWIGPWDRTNRYFFPICGHTRCIIRARLRRKVHKEHARNKARSKEEQAQQEEVLNKATVNSEDDFEKRVNLSHKAIWEGLKEMSKHLKKRSHEQGKPPTSKEFRDNYRRMIRNDQAIQNNTKIWENIGEISQKDCTKTSLTEQEREKDAENRITLAVEGASNPWICRNPAYMTQSISQGWLYTVITHKVCDICRKDGGRNSKQSWKLKQEMYLFT